MVTRNDSVWKNLDWILVGLYLLLVVAGWFSICGASYEYGSPDLFDFSTNAGKQFVWILCSFGLGFVLLMLEDKFYDVFSYFIYTAFVLLLLATIFIGSDINGSHSWIKLGSMSIQPAEFAKFATALAIAKYMKSYSFNIHRFKSFAVLLFLTFLPMALIILQKETGSALVYFSFFLVFYREGMPGVILFSGLCAVLYFVLGVKFGQVMMGDSPTVIGEFLVLSMILVFTSGMIRVYEKKWKPIQYIAAVTGGVLLLAVQVSVYYMPFNLSWVLVALLVALVVYLVYLALSERKRSYSLIALFAVLSVGFYYSSDYVFDKVMQPHQQIRIKVLLGMEEDPTGAGYNVNQSKIAIGSGGVLGKGFLKGTQTKLKYVPEQHTDFIFCTVGEEQGFVGSSAVLLLYLAFILRLIYLSERQSSVFCRVYGYSVLSIFLFHVFINVGMVLGLLPVIGIPLPFFSYGGSSLWGFTILLFIFLRLDVGRKHRL